MWGLETILVDHGFGGGRRCDRIVSDHYSLWIWDYKTQGVKASKSGTKKPVIYDSWARQLAFYAVAYAKQIGAYPQIPLCKSIIIDSTEASAPYIHNWTKEEILEAHEDFVLAAYAWFKKRTYWPQAGGKFSITSILGRSI